MSDNSALTDAVAERSSLIQTLALVAGKANDIEPSVVPTLANNGESQACAARERENQTWDFVEDHDDKGMFLCKICMCVLMEPHLITCCGECVCRRCIDRHLLRVSSMSDDRKKSCPFCRKDDFKLIENFDLKKSIYKLKVFCLYRKRGCMWSGKRSEGETHLHECVFCPIDCPNKCEHGKIERRNLRKHIAECPMQVVECMFEPVGCKKGNPLPRQEIEVHLNQDVHQHLILLAKSTLKMREEFDATISALCLSQNEVLKEKSEMIHSKKQELTKLEQDVKSLEIEFFVLQQRIDMMKQLDRANGAKYMAKLNAGCSEVKGLRAVCQMTLADFQALPVPSAGNIIFPPVTFSIDHFSVRKAHNEKWISSPFYTHCRGGYKMCLSVLPNGNKEVQGNYVSLFVHLMQGEFDDHLKWPFPGALINISALNQSVLRRGNVSANISLYTRESLESRSRVRDSPYGPGYGRQKFMNHSHLNQFLTKDTFKIMIYNIQQW